MSKIIQTLDMVEENNIIQQLRERISDVIPDDAQLEQGFYLYFYLKEKSIREILKWRKENQVEKAAAVDYNAELFQCFKVRTDGRTKSGFPVYTSYAGRLKFNATVSRFGKEAVIFYWLQLLAKAEKLIVECNRQARKEYGNEVSIWPPSRKSILILDMTGMAYFELLNREIISVFVTLVRMAVGYFPALEGTLIFINAGRFLEIFFKLIRPLLHGSNIDLQVYGSSPEKWKPFVLEHIDPGQLMQAFGGTMNDER